MEHLFYALPEDFDGHNFVKITGQEAKHISKVLRFKEGDEIQISDGLGKVYDCQITATTKSSVSAQIQKVKTHPKPTVRKVMVFGAIKKRDRLEFAVEKAVELNASEICIFNADHSERSKINKDRMTSVVLSAYKQSKRNWLPKIHYLDSLEEVLDHYQDYTPVLAHVAEEVKKPPALPSKKNVFLIGPEGGFSDREINMARQYNAQFISLGKTRLRAETAVMAMLSQYLFTD